MDYAEMPTRALAAMVLNGRKQLDELPVRMRVPVRNMVKTLKQERTERERVAKAKTSKKGKKNAGKK
jgi:hypothetical protein